MRLLALSALAFAPLLAHHATTAQYDSSQVVTLTGEIANTEWMNPHTKLFLTVEGISWELELGTAVALVQKGVTRATFVAGDQVTVELWVAKDGTKKASLRKISWPDGRSLSGETMWDFPLTPRP